MVSKYIIVIQVLNISLMEINMKSVLGMAFPLENVGRKDRITFPDTNQK